RPAPRRARRRVRRPARPRARGPAPPPAPRSTQHMATLAPPRPKSYDDTFWKPISLWLTTTDHKLIGIMYMTTGILSFVVGGVFALIMRVQLSQPNETVLTADTYNQLLSAHGTTMIFFFVAIFMTGIANYFVPIMVGARDMAFPRLNLLGFWMIPFSILIYYAGFFTPQGALNAGWTAYAPLTEKQFNPGLGVDFWALSLIIWALSGIMASTNFLTTIVALRAPGMTLRRLPLFVWAQISTSILLLAVVAALFGIVFLSVAVWAHHMFTVGLNIYVETWFMFMTMAIAVPTGIKFFNWIATAWAGSIDFKLPMKFAFGFMATFLIGGITGIYLSSVPVDTQLHQSYYVVAHLHYVLFGGSVLTIFAGIYYWFPKITGRKLNETLGEWHFWTVFIGFNATFLVMHTLGLEGMPRRIYTYPGGFGEEGWGATNMFITAASFLVALSVLLFLLNVIHRWKHGEPSGDDPWAGNTLEWAATSPPAPYNFDRVPPVRSFMPLRDLRAEQEAAVRRAEAAE